jgi:hypothetical protein
MAEEIWLLRYGLEALGAFLVTLGGWIVRGHSRRMERLEAHQQKSTLDLEAHKIDSERYKLEAEQRFAKDIMVQATLSRLHDRIDDISTDVKAILRNYEEGRR